MDDSTESRPEGQVASGFSIPDDATFKAFQALSGQNPPLVMATWVHGGCEMCECVDFYRAKAIADALTQTWETKRARLM